MVKMTCFLQLLIFLFATLLLFSACVPPVNQAEQQQTLSVNQQFQKQLTPIPTVPTYRCGAWASPNMPAAYSPIIIYARLTQGSTNGLAGITAHAMVHFKNGDVPLSDQPASDINGYVTFSVFLARRQPSLVPATVDVTFKTPDSSITCTAFFTPQ